MKKILFFIFVLLFLANLTFSLKNKSKDLSIKNMEILQASAGEAECENTSTHPCRIIISGQVILQGYGQPKVIYP
jgi:hypothetical protein